MRATLTSSDMERARIPRRYWQGILLGNIPDSAPHKAPVSAYLRDMEKWLAEGQGLYLYSKMNGTGKTAIATMAAKKALLLDRTVLYVHADDIQDYIIDGVPFDANLSMKDRMAAVDLLIVDELGKEARGKSGWSEGKIESLFRDRVQDTKTTVITTNLGDPKKLASAYSQDLVELLMEAYFAFEIFGEREGGRDWRAYLAQERLNQLTEAVK